jgi:hypothetical protein
VFSAADPLTEASVFEANGVEEERERKSKDKTTER